MHSLHPRSILADNLLWRDKEEGENGASSHQDEEANICAIVDGFVVFRVPILDNWGNRADHSAHVEDGPEETDVTTFLGFGGVGHHDSALGCPEEGCTYSEEGTGKDNKAGVLGMVVAQEGGRVEGVSEAAEGKTGLCSNCKS